MSCVVLRLGCAAGAFLEPYAAPTGSGLAVPGRHRDDRGSGLCDLLGIGVAGDQAAMRLQGLYANYFPQLELELLVPTPGKACRPRPILLLDRKLQSDSNFLMSSDFSFLFRMSLMCGSAAAANHRRYSDIGQH